MNGIEYKFALVVEADILPVSFPNTQTKIEKLHITLMGGKYLKQHKAVLKTFDFSILPNPPAPLMDRIGEARRVVGGKNGLQHSFHYPIKMSLESMFHPFVP